MSHDQPKYLTVKEVAEQLRVSKMTVYRLTEDGSLPSVRVGRSIRIPKLHFDAYINTIHEEIN